VSTVVSLKGSQFGFAMQTWCASRIGDKNAVYKLPFAWQAFTQLPQRSFELDISATSSFALLLAPWLSAVDAAPASGSRVELEQQERVAPILRVMISSASSSPVNHGILASLLLFSHRPMYNAFTAQISEVWNGHVAQAKASTDEAERESARWGELMVSALNHMKEVPAVSPLQWPSPLKDESLTTGTWKTRNMLHESFCKYH
jgi:hypothetical protein